ncbi:probable leucine-rich repeat receptor-like serine/threonine-protein kinase At3g14840 [Helianthus annuus]|uniref:probable leucine-rich repeat receptor-like serine/threonine-protein kinase At3g14840 n=1 Tax=Helianthus annuus TaxID=4232 RepID=UPI001652D4D6|nr:probable leucine-rich repeat receptor-like serine/threonine-protein kinase At3g14840 [Helianthus annuus]
MLWAILCVTFLPFVFASMNTTCLPPEEVDALREIGRKLGKLNWDFERDPCLGWEISSSGAYSNNLTCSLSNNSTCHVISISLRGQSLPGILPPEFVNLPYLLNLDLTRNYLSGTIPPEWGSMEQILNISLIANRLTGSIPKELGNISTLRSLMVEDNMMSGAIPDELGNLASIERLLLSSNFFTGELPASFANLINMKDFRIGSNNFSGKIPDFIGEWNSLTSLRIQASGLEGPIPPNITLLTTLTDLRISDLRGPDTHCPPFKNASFKTLILRSCNLIGRLPKSVHSTDLLDFSFNKLSGSIPERFIDLTYTGNIYLTRNFLSGTVPDWMITSGHSIDLSYNNFTIGGLRDYRCQMRQTNLFASFSVKNTSRKVSCLGNSFCPTNSSPSTTLYINCGGGKLRLGDREYESDLELGGASYFYAAESRWGFSSTGNFLDDNNWDSYIVQEPCGVPRDTSGLYTSARTSALSLTYYGFCMHSGSYNVRLHFAEIIFTDDRTYSSLGRRVFDIYIQGVLVEKDFDISDRAGGVMKAIVTTYTVNVTTSLEIRLYWAGKGTTNIPSRGVYGPLISAISVDPNFKLPENEKGVSRRIVAVILVGAVCAIILILGILWWCGYLCPTHAMELELHGLELNIGSFTLRQIKTATNNFDVANKIGEGGFGSVYKGVLPSGTLIAVKQLSSKSKQGNREFLNELGMISALQHPHLVKLYGCCIEGNQLLLAYEYMENNSLARALFGPKEWQLELDWPTRYRICIGIARGLAFLHEESRLKIVHRDIKATNVLLDKDLNAKISDFGLARLNEEDKTHISTRVAGTYGYMAPEYAMRGYLTDKADVYSYGIVLLEIVSGMANVADRENENQFVLLERAFALKATGNLMDLVDPKLGSEYDIQEMMVVINLALVCTAITPTDRPTMSSVVSMLEGRIVPEVFPAEQSDSMTEMDRDKRVKELEDQNGNRIVEMPFACTDSSTSAVDLYPNDGFSEYLQKRDSDIRKLLSK